MKWFARFGVWSITWGITTFWIVFWTKKAVAYIPSYSMLLSQLALTQGSGMYRIEQQVDFKHSANNISLIETWWVTGKGQRGSQMRLDVRAVHQKKKVLYLRLIYHGLYKIFKDEKSKQTRRKISLYHIDKPFHLRDSESLGRLFYLWGFTPFFNSKDQPLEQKSWIHLARRQGVVHYRLAKKSLSKPEGLWLEQDEFVIRRWQWKKLSTQSKGELIAWDYRAYPGSLFFPSSRRLSWNGHQVLIKVKSIKKIPINKQLFKTSHLVKKNIISSQLLSLDQDSINEFYQTFR